MTNCIHGTPSHFAPDAIINSLPESQGTIARHKCVVCAYVAGISVSLGAPYSEEFSECTHGSIAPVEMISSLPIYQGGIGRHKCVHCAYAAGMNASTLEDLVSAYHQSYNKIGTTEALAAVKVRVGQNIFRANLIKFWRAKCAATKIRDVRLLRASHIVPWSKCDNDAMRLDTFNGILLSPLWDAAFDNGFVSFHDTGMPIFSSGLSKKAGSLLADSFVEPISFHPKTMRYLEWHRSNQLIA